MSPDAIHPGSSLWCPEGRAIALYQDTEDPNKWMLSVEGSPSWYWINKQATLSYSLLCKIEGYTYMKAIEQAVWEYNEMKKEEGWSTK
jgi:hypothetical protein